MFLSLHSAVEVIEFQHENVVISIKEVLNEYKTVEKVTWSYTGRAI